MTIRQFHLSAIAAAAGVTAGPVTPLAGDIGIGISGLSYFDQSFAMVDVARQSAFRGLDWGAVDLDANGSPTEDFRLIYSSEVIGAGTYKLKFKGSADFPGTNKIYDAGSNTTTADYVLATNAVGNIWIDFTNTRRTAGSSVADGLTDIQMFRPGYATDGSDVFTAEFISAMQKFSVIRTMDFVSANGNPNENWSERTSINVKGDPGPAAQSWELMVLMANATNRDLWITIPVKANDAYIDKLAKLIKYGSDGSEPYTSTQASPVYPPLNSSLKLYVEYGNEIWNSGPGFNGFVWVLELANANRLNTEHPIAHDGAVTDQYLALRRWIAYRSAFISLAFRSVFGDAAMMTRVRPIFAGQVGNANNYLSDGLMWAEAYHGNVGALWYGGGGAAYYGSTTDPSNTDPGTMTAFFAGMPEPDFADRTRVDVTWTKGLGLKTIAYEGGPGPGGSSTGGFSGSAELSYAYNNDPRMKDRMQVAHSTWVANGGDMLVYYIYSGPAPWSFTNGVSGATVSDTTSVKMQAIDAIKAGAQPVAAFGTLVPGTVYLRDASAKVISTEGGGSLWGYGGTAWLLRPSGAGSNHDQFLMIPIRVAASGSYKISVTSYDAAVGAAVDIFGNGILLGDVLLNQGADGVATQSPEVTATLEEGITVMRVRVKGGQNVWLKDLIVEPA